MGDTQLFLVRVWQAQLRFRASVRPPAGGEPHLFTEPAQVGEFLRAASAAAANESEGERHEGEQ